MGSVNIILGFIFLIGFFVLPIGLGIGARKRGQSVLLAVLVGIIFGPGLLFLSLRLPGGFIRLRAMINIIAPVIGYTFLTIAIRSQDMRKEDIMLPMPLPPGHEDSSERLVE